MKINTHSEVLHGNRERIEHFSIDCVIFQIDQFHLLSDLLKCRLGTEGSEISSDVTMALVSDLELCRLLLLLFCCCFFCFDVIVYLLEIHILAQFHVLRVNSQHLESADRIGNSNVDFTIETT